MKPKISLITLGVSNLDNSIKFYTDLGFNIHDYKDGDKVAFFKLDSTWLSLFPKRELAEDATVAYQGSGFKSFTLAYNVSSEKEVDNVYKHALSVGAKPTKKPQKTKWGGYSGYFEDLDGFLWEIAFNPFIDLA